MKINFWEYVQFPLFISRLKEMFATKNELDNKVDKVPGKALSTNDYTTAEKEKVTKLNFSKLVSSCEISGYTLTFKDINDDVIKTFDIPQPTFSIVDGDLFVSY